MIEARIKEAVEDHLAMPTWAAPTTLDTTLRAELMAYDFELEDLTYDLEAMFNITISEDEMSAAQTVGDLVKLVEGKI